MLNEVQTRNYNLYQKLYKYLTANTSVYSSYVPFNREVQSFITNFNLFKSFMPQSSVNGISTTNSQIELKNKIALQVANICDIVIAYAEQYNDEKLAAAVNYSKYDVLRFKDYDIYTLVSCIISVLQPMLTDEHFLEYDIHEEMLESVMTDAITFDNNLEKSSWTDAGSYIVNLTSGKIIQQLDRNIQQLDRLINKFASTHPGFVAGYHINSSLESPITYYTSTEGTIIRDDGKLISNSLISIANKKEVLTNGMGNFAIINISGCECEITVDASGVASKMTIVRIPHGNTAEVNIAL